MSDGVHGYAVFRLKFVGLALVTDQTESRRSVDFLLSAGSFMAQTLVAVGILGSPASCKERLFTDLTGASFTHFEHVSLLIV
jgi:hypothetical protein